MAAGDVVKLIDSNTKENVNYVEVAQWHDGSAMSEAKCDGVIYRKKGSRYYVRPEYLSKNEIHISWFGAKGDGVTDDTSAIQAAFNVARQISEDTFSYSGSHTLIVFAPKVYCISSTVTINIAYGHIDFNKCLIVPHSSVGGVGTTHNFWALDFLFLWVGGFNNLNIKGFKNGLRLFNPNIDTGHIMISQLNIMNCVNTEINLRSSQCTIDGFRMANSDTFYVRQCDKLTIRSGWINGAVMTKKWSGMFVIDYSAIVVFENLIWTPNGGQTFAAHELFWIKNIGGSIIHIDRCQFGGEGGQINLVGNFVESATGRGSNIIISKTQAFASDSPWVMLFNMPNKVTIEDFSGTVDANHNYSVVHYASDAQILDYNSIWPVQALPPATHPDRPNQSQPVAKTYDTMLEDVLWLAQIRISGSPTGEIFTPSQRKLFRFLVGPQGERYGYYQIPPDETKQDLLFDSRNNSVNAWQANRYRAWKVSLLMAGSNGSGRYSEFIVTCDWGKVFFVEPIFQGAHTIAPTLSVVDNVVKVGLTAGNGNVYAKVEIASCNTDANEG